MSSKSLFFPRKCYNEQKKLGDFIDFRSAQEKGKRGGGGGRQSIRGRMNQINVLTQTFVDGDREAKYRQHRDPTDVYNLLALPLALTWLTFFVLATSSWYYITII